jgi:predicted ribosome quality control (RQC) complex YloA/Tae2 family protein
MANKEKMNFRKACTCSGKLLIAGKNAEQNEQVIGQIGKDEIVLHTKSPGSPFVNIKSKASEVSKEDIKEAAIFCTRYSQAWKKAKQKPNNVEVHYFLGKNIFKNKGMKLGTFGVKKLKKIIIKKEEIEK